MTAEQNEFADEIFKDYVSRDILGLSEKHADVVEKKRVAKERKEARRAAMKAFFATPFVEMKSFYNRKKKEFKLYRQGFRKVTSKRRREFFRFCAERQVANVRKYIKSGHPVDDLDSDGRTGMHHAAAEVSLHFFFTCFVDVFVFVFVLISLLSFLLSCSPSFRSTKRKRKETRRPKILIATLFLSLSLSLSFFFLSGTRHSPPRAVEAWCRGRFQRAPS
jgi:hypothetical protein